MGNILAWLLTLLGPKGLEFGKYSIDYHTIRNYLYVSRHWGRQRAEQHIPGYAKRIVKEYDAEAGGRPVDKRLQMAPSMPRPAGAGPVAPMANNSVKK
ncbi:MAG: hypothetical protein VKK42_24625 [Lyngbya sp.]|nr:hypothetical protein [Lyngbya sp.]